MSPILGFILMICFIIMIIISSIIYEKKEFLKKYGYKYPKIIELNSQQDFSFRNFNYTFKLAVNSKRKLENLNLYEIVMNGYNENTNGIKSMYSNYIDEKTKYDKYLEKFYEILEKQVKYNENIIEKTKLFSNVDKFIKYENKEIEKERIKFTYKYNINVVATYDSPGGRNHYSKSNSFNAEDVHDFIKILNQRNEYEKTKKFQREIMSDSLRYDILKRDNYRCKICGAAASDGARLEVDHIIPISKGGKTTKNNLQTLCDRCNRGKSDKYM